MWSSLYIASDLLRLVKGGKARNTLKKRWGTYYRGVVIELPLSSREGVSYWYLERTQPSIRLDMHYPHPVDCASIIKTPRYWPKMALPDVQNKGTR